MNIEETRPSSYRESDISRRQCNSDALAGIRSNSITQCRSERVSEKRSSSFSNANRITNKQGDMGTSHYFEQILNKRVGVKDCPMFRSQIASDAGVGFGANLRMFTCPKNIKKVIDEEEILYKEVRDKVQEQRNKMEYELQQLQNEVLGLIENTKYDLNDQFDTYICKYEENFNFFKNQAGDWKNSEALVKLHKHENGDRMVRLNGIKFMGKKVGGFNDIEELQE